MRKMHTMKLIKMQNRNMWCSVGRRRTTTLEGTTDVVLTNLEGSVSDAHRGIVLKCIY
jgi:hypothetical protein